MDRRNAEGIALRCALKKNAREIVFPGRGHHCGANYLGGENTREGITRWRLELASIAAPSGAITR